MSVKRTLLLAGGMALAIAWNGQNANAQNAFTITSSSFKDGERLATKMAGNNKQKSELRGRERFARLVLGESRRKGPRAMR